MKANYLIVFTVLLLCGLLVVLWTENETPKKGPPDTQHHLPAFDVAKEEFSTSAPSKDVSTSKSKENGETKNTAQGETSAKTADKNSSGQSTAPKNHDIPAPKSFTQSTHIAYLQSLGVIESTISIRENSEKERLSLVRVDGDTYPYVLIRERFRPSENTPYQTNVQVGGHALVRLKDDLSNLELARFLTNHRLKVVEKLPFPRSYLLKFDDVNLGRLVALEKALDSDPRVESTESDNFFYASARPNDPRLGSLWGLTGEGQIKKNTDIGATLSWDLLTDCSSTVVAVLDSGIDSNHPDLRENIRADLGRSFVPNTSPTDYIDRNGHGTHVAGTIGAVGNNNIGVAGICWKAAIIPIKVIGDNGAGTTAAIINGLNYAASSPAKVLNMSLGRTGAASPLETEAMNRVASAGKLIVVAAGNENANNDATPGFPATFPSPNRVSVAAVGPNGELADFSNFGATSVDIAAPGVRILSTYLSSSYDELQGTSMASPHVAGATALFWSYAPRLSAKEVKDFLLNSTTQQSFSKRIVGGRKLDLFKLMTAVQARVQIKEIESEGTITVTGPKSSLSLIATTPYAQVAKVELLHDGKVIATSKGQSQSIEFPWTQMAQILALSVRVTDTDGRISLSEEINVPVNVEKSIDFSAIDVGTMAGNISCKVTRKASDQETLLHERRLDSIQSCKTFCAVVGPLIHSSKAQIRCGVDKSIYYQRNPPS
jgi:subtilisin family serine protease